MPRGVADPALKFFALAKLNAYIHPRNMKKRTLHIVWSCGLPSCDIEHPTKEDAQQHIEEHMSEIHPAPNEFTDEEVAQDHILRYFHYAHLPPGLQIISGTFCTLARFVVDNLPRNPERTVALRKLLEAKDAAVRANL